MDPGEYDHQAIETAARALWQAHDVYRYDRDREGPVFSVDTPPPYVSAAHLHVGHAMSYSQPDFIVRYRRFEIEQRLDIATHMSDLERLSRTVR